MARAERLATINYLLGGGRTLRLEDLVDRLEVSPSTVKRDIQYLRDRNGVPIDWDSDRGGWFLNRNQPVVGTQYELPGLWLSGDEIAVLMTMQQLLADLDGGGLLGPYLQPLVRKLVRLIGSDGAAEAEVAHRIRVLTVASRRLNLPHFQALGSALLRRKRLHLFYRARSSAQDSDRVVSPQRLVHYRDNWYLDAWCHSREALRSFSVDAVTRVEVLDQAAVELTQHQLDDELGSGYGIFAGAQVQMAQLRFGAERARWVAAERWHPNQIGRWDDQGRWLLTVPYSDARELVMDVLRHMPDVEVIAPDELRDEVVRRLREGIRAQGVDE